MLQLKLSDLAPAGSCSGFQRHYGKANLSATAQGALRMVRSRGAQDEAPVSCSAAAERRTRSAVSPAPRGGRTQTAAPGSTVESGVSADLLKLGLQIKEIHILLSTFMSV